MTVRQSPILAAILPSSVVAMEHDGVADPALLDPLEASHLGGALPKRIEEFTAGRLCARACLACFDVHDFALRVAQDRRPLWPTGFVGSITHTRGFRASVVARRETIAAIGIDAEIADGFDQELLAYVATQKERAWLRELPDSLRARYACLIFSAKEAFYKCQYELSREFVDFTEVEIVPDLAGLPTGEFAVVTRKRIGPIPLAARLPGRFAWTAEHVVTAMYLPASPAWACSRTRHS